MCGFLAEFCFEGQNLISKVDFESLLLLSKRRGPDSTGLLVGENYRLGFNRLAILDLSEKGNQPKSSPTQRYHVVFNGELYNFKELSKNYNLQNLNSTSDTEILIHLLDLLGVEETIKELNGMFAITIIDSQTEMVYLTRDFAGIKPLFYGITNYGIVTASQFDQIFKHPRFSKNLEIRPDIVKEYFGFGYMQAPNTIYKNIFQVPPGVLITYDRFGKKNEKHLISFSKQRTGKESSDLPTYGPTLESIIERQLMSDVPIATFLSGGIDSPLISAYAKKRKKDIQAFTLKVNDPNVNESEIAKAYAQHLDLDQEVVEIDESNLLKSLKEHFLAYSEPFGDYSSIPTYAVCREAKKRHTVMLSGDGGDELFFGYPRMLDVLRKRYWFKLPVFLRRPLIRITNKLGLTNTWAPHLKNFNAFVVQKHLKIPQLVLDTAFKDISYSNEMKALYDVRNKSSKEVLHQLRHNEYYAHMQRVLIKVDRASMYHSLEVRVPFLDKESVFSAWNFIENFKAPKDLKKVLKNLLAKEVPKDLINQRKFGFTVPLFKWLHGELKEDVLQVVINTPFYGKENFNEDALKGFVLDFFDGKHSNVWGVWHIYAWQKWAINHVQ